jgi:DNA-binding MarR family transcriptional regulator
VQEARVQPIYDSRTFSVDSNIGYLLGRVRAALHESVDRELAPHGITIAQGIVVYLIRNGIARTAADISRVTACDPGATTRMIDRLERKGLVRRVRSRSDRRSVTLELTPQGKSVYPKISAIAVKVLNRYLRGFSRTEVRHMEKFLGRMLNNGENGRASPAE